MKRRVTWIAAVVCFLLSTQVVLYAQSEPDHVKIIVAPNMLGTANTTIAIVEGYFADQNIDVEYVEVSTTTDAEVMALLVNGEIDVVQAAWTPGLFNAIARGAQVRVVAVATYNDPDSCPYAGFFVRAGEGENFDMESLRGAHIGIAAGGTQYYFDKWLSGGGMSIDDVIVENVPNGARAEALANGSVVLASLSEPALSVAVRELGFDIVVNYSDIVPDGSLSALLFGPNMLNRDDDLPVRYLTAFLQGSRQFNEGPTERNLEILGPALELEPDVLAQSCWITFRENGLLNTDTVLDYMNWLNSEGLLDEMLTVDEFYDPTYAEQAYEHLTAAATPEAEATAE